MKLKNLTFKGGIHIPEFKELSEHMAIEAAAPVKEVAIPLMQHVGVPCEPLVKRGDRVLLGQKIGDSEAGLSAPVHASVSGKVKKIEERFTSGGSRALCVVIENDGEDARGFELTNRNIEDISVEDMILLVREAGVIGMGGAAFPAHAKLQGAQKGIDTVIINAAECEPYLTCDHRMMLEYADRLLDGLKVMMKITKAKQGIIGIEDNKPDAIEHLTIKLRDYSNLHVAQLKTKFPQGDSYRMVDSILNRKVPVGGRTGSVHALVTNVGTCIAIGDAVVRNIPSYERVVTLTGDGISQPKNILTRIGTSIEDMIAMGNGFSKEPKAIIVGGPMTGFAQFDETVPVQKNTSGVLVLGKDPATEYEMGPCIRCAKCVEGCPVNLLPLTIAQLALKGRFEETAKYHAQSCIACGSCSYICPAHRPLTELITAAKRELKTMAKTAR
ncbi:MAG: electron transport complex subunit RsxC [Tissierellia bacterium]|nr:electron transport complex subunit RsxC [Tissierellia bacterium]